MSDPDAIAERVTEDLAQVSKKVGANTVVLYPYATYPPHCPRRIREEDAADRGGDAPGERYEGPSGAIRLVQVLQDQLQGHPLSKLSREMRLEAKKVEVEKCDPRSCSSRYQDQAEQGRSQGERSPHHRTETGPIQFLRRCAGNGVLASQGLVIRNALIDFWRGRA